MMKFLAVVLAVALMAQTGLALKCYQCSSSTDSSICGDKFNGTSTKVCNLDQEGACVTQKIKSSIGSIRTTARSCQPMPKSVMSEVCESYKAAMDLVGVTVEQCSVCTTDYCNGGPKSVAVSLSALLLVVGVALKQTIFS